MTRISLALIVVALVAGPLKAQVGQTGFSFLKLGVGSRSFGMGEAHVAVASDPAATYYNPSALTLARNPQLLFMHREWFQDTRMQFLGAQTPIGPVVVGLGVNTTSIDNIEIRETPGTPLGTFSARNAAIGLSIGYLVDPKLSIGATTKYLYEKIFVNEASGLGFDIGALYVTPWDLRVGLAVSNMGSVNELQHEASSLPTIVRVGGAYVRPLGGFDGELILASDIVSISGEGKTHVNFGAELNYRNSFMVRTGYQTGYEARTISSGAGFRYGAIRFDYAFAPLRNDLGSAHTLSVGIEFQ